MIMPRAAGKGGAGPGEASGPEFDFSGLPSRQSACDFDFSRLPSQRNPTEPEQQQAQPATSSNNPAAPDAVSGAQLPVSEREVAATVAPPAQAPAIQEGPRPQPSSDGKPFDDFTPPATPGAPQQGNKADASEGLNYDCSAMCIL